MGIILIVLIISVLSGIILKHPHPSICSPKQVFFRLFCGCILANITIIILLLSAGLTEETVRRYDINPIGETKQQTYYLSMNDTTYRYNANITNGFHTKAANIDDCYVKYDNETYLLIRHKEYKSIMKFMMSGFEQYANPQTTYEFHIPENSVYYN